jgi:hypothetical protein
VVTVTAESPVAVVCRVVSADATSVKVAVSDLSGTAAPGVTLHIAAHA